MRQIFLHHLVGHLTHGGTKVASCPEMSPPVTLFQHGKSLEQLTRGASLDPAHDFARGHVRRGRDENVHVILAHHPLQDLDLEEPAGLPHHLSYPQGDISSEHLVGLKLEKVSYGASCFDSAVRGILGQVRLDFGHF